MAAKRCGDLIPLCHPLGVESVEVDFDLPELSTGDDSPARLRIKATARISAKTGVEMEALTAVAVAALTVYDMCKAIDKTMAISDVRLVSKNGGKIMARRGQEDRVSTPLLARGAVRASVGFGHICQPFERGIAISE